MGEPSGEDTEALRARARERIEQGRLPRTRAVKTWGGLGSGLRCDLCDAAIASSEPEFELQLDLATAESVRFHRQCHTIWSEIREAFTAGGWRAVASEPPPIGAVIEARVMLSRAARSGAEARSIILNVMCLDESPGAADPPGTGRAPPAAGTWINATTGGPLPEGWRPVEWRPLPAGPGEIRGAGAKTAALHPKRA